MSEHVCLTTTLSIAFRFNFRTPFVVEPDNQTTPNFPS
jgi:hypothetical protein